MQRTAPLARLLAPAFEIQRETAFTIGLLHDVGKLIVFDYLSEMRAERRHEIVVPERCLLDLLSRLHEPLGGIAALRWSLGEEAARAIACHHFEPPPEKANPLGELLCVAERADHAQRTWKMLDLDALWKERGLTTNLPTVREALDAAEDIPLTHRAPPPRTA